MLNVLFFHRLAEIINSLHRRYRTRRQLRQLDCHQLRDIGVSRSEALKEAKLPFWRSGTTDNSSTPKNL